MRKFGLLCFLTVVIAETNFRSKNESPLLTCRHLFAALLSRRVDLPKHCARLKAVGDPPKV